MKKPTLLRLVKAFLIVYSLFSFSPAIAQNDSLQNAVSLTYDRTHFDRQFADDWQLASLEYKHNMPFGALLGRVNYANRFARSGWQLEGEAYPSISKKLYAYAGLSYSNDVPVFPRWRSGGSLYYNFAKRWEAEGGFRYLSFDQHIWMGTAGLSRYAGAWLLNVRSFFSIAAPLNSQSFFFKAQRYLKNEKDYLWLQVGSGISPDESRSVQLNATSQLVSKRMTAGAKLSLNDRMQVLLSAGYARDEYQSKTFGNQYTGSAGVGVRF